MEQVAVADLIREAIDVYIEALEDEENIVRTMQCHNSNVLGKIKVFKDRKGNDLMPYVLSKDGRHEVVAPVSSVRIGETRRDFVKSKACVDYARWVALFVGRSENECKSGLTSTERWC